MSYNEESDGIKGRTRNGSPMFYELLQEAAETHDKKSHDYATNNNPFGNYHFAGQMALLFSHSPNDAGFMGRLAEKIYRLANLESSGKIAKNESIEDTERDIAVIATLWMASRREERFNKRTAHLNQVLNRDEPDKAIQTESAYGESSLDTVRNTIQEIDEATREFEKRELYDLIKLMPDSQTQRIVDFIYDMRAIRRQQQNQAKMAKPARGYKD